MLLRWLQQQLINEHMTWWLMKIGLARGFLRLKSSMHILFKFFSINNGMEFMFSSFWTFLKVLIDVIFALNTYKFCLIVIVTSHLYYVCML
jgi:hypothetical protein